MKNEETGDNGCNGLQRHEDRCKGWVNAFLANNLQSVSYAAGHKTGIENRNHARLNVFPSEIHVEDVLINQEYEWDADDAGNKELSR